MTALRSAGAGPEPSGRDDGRDELDGDGFGFGLGELDGDEVGDGEGVGDAWQSPRMLGARQ